MKRLQSHHTAQKLKRRYSDQISHHRLHQRLLFWQIPVQPILHRIVLDLWPYCKRQHFRGGWRGVGAKRSARGMAAYYWNTHGLTHPV